MTDMPAPAPAKGSLWPYFMMEDSLAAADFYGKAFGAEVVGMFPPGDEKPKVNVHLYINGHSLMLMDPMPQHGHGFRPHAGCMPQMRVEDVDAAYAKAVAAGATVNEAPHNAFWGDRYGSLTDPFGITWGITGPPKS